MAEALFSSDLSSPQAQGAATVAPIESVNYGSVFKTVANIGEGILKYQEQEAKAEIETRKNSAVTEFINEHNRLSAAKQAGQINDSQYNVRSQASFRQFAANNPFALDELKKAAGGLKEFGGLGDVQDEVQALKSDLRSAVSAAQKDGFEVTLNDPIEHQQLVARQHRQSIMTKKAFEERRAARSEVREEEKFKRESWEFGNKQEARATLSSMVADGLPVLNSLSEVIRNQWTSASPEQQQELMARWDREITKWKSQVAIVSQGDSGMASAVDRMVGDLDGRFRNLLTGKDTAESMKNRVGVYLDAARGQLLADPEVARLFAQFGYAPNGLEVIMKHTTDPNILKKALGNIVKPTNSSADFNNPEEVRVTVESFNQLYNDPSLTPEQKAEVFKNTGNNVLRGLGNAIVNNADPKAIRSAIDFVKSPVFIENIGNLDQGAYNAAKHAVNTYYNQPVVTDITQKLAQPMNPPLNNKTPLQAMSIEVGPNGVKFVPNGDYDPMAAFTMRASEKALNDLIIANAHLDGTKDYKAYWEKNRGYLFPSLYGHPDVLKVGDIVYGKKFLGGLVNDPKNWEKLGDNYSEGRIGGQPTQRSNFSSGRIGGEPTTKSTNSAGKIQ